MVSIGAIGLALDTLMRGLERSKALAWGFTLTDTGQPRAPQAAAAGASTAR
jgi:hypothetical protein